MGSAYLLFIEQIEDDSDLSPHRYSNFDKSEVEIIFDENSQKF